ncbi:DUF975 domain-containing protein [Blautia pseudococcoides]|uniref:DUF975 family protein n=2 Tax=Blautia pseudococcoides TaxID=1796616 RepID=A0A1C7IC10_9FIRM|nr:hypothetical protein A4V09_16390 [Blautia pseudococcoides]ASU29996.1 DUF975 domain-containing protein [Blautia pseudococcoides]
MGDDNMWNRMELKMNGKANFLRNYGPAVLVSLIASLVAAKYGRNYDSDGASGSFLEFSGLHLSFDWDHLFFNWGGNAFSSGAVSLAVILLDVFIFQMLLVGACRFYVENRDYKAPVSKLLFGFQSGFYGNSVLVMFMKNLFVALWTLLLVIPGIVMSYAYRMVPYILAEQPDIDYREALRISKEMMYGQKWEAFFLDLSFIGWLFVGAVTCGIAGIFYVKPYVDATNVELYVTLREDWFAKSARESY